MDFRHLGAIWERFAVAGHAVPKGGDCDRIPQDHSKLAAVLAHRDDQPVFVSPELGECEPTRHFDRVFVLSGKEPCLTSMII